MNWNDLRKELDLWEQEGLTATFWWRDDDAHSLTPQLLQLCQLSEHYNTPVALAVIPNQIHNSLVEHYKKSTCLRIFQHGYDHINHGKGTGRAGELEDHRSQTDVYRDLIKGRQILKKYFPDSLDVLVPPWNKIAEEYILELPSLGFKGLSRFSNHENTNTSGLTEINCHLDIIKWKKPPFFRGTTKCLKEIIEHLQAKRIQNIDTTEPTGILSHHLDHDSECFDFLDYFLLKTTDHSACQWLDPKEMFL